MVPVFAEATLTTGTVSGNTVTVDLAHPLAKVTNFIGQENDYSPFYFPFPDLLGRQVKQKIASGQIQNLFLVLRLPTTTPFPGISGRPPLIWLDGNGDVPVYRPVLYLPRREHLEPEDRPQLPFRAGGHQGPLAAASR